MKIQSRLSSLGLVWGLWLPITVASLTAGGGYSPAFHTYTIIVLLAGFLISQRAGIGVAVVSALAGLLIVWLTQPGAIVPAASPLNNSWLHWLIGGLALGVAAIIQYVEVGSLNETLNQARRNEQALAESNRALQARTLELERSEAALRQSLETLHQDVTERKKAEENHQHLLSRVEAQHSQLRALTTRLARMEENERKHLAHVLHDGVAQNLTGLNLNLNVLRHYVQNEVAASSRIHLRLQDAIGLVEQTTVQIRNVMTDLRPPVLDDYGLLATLEWYAAQITLNSGLPVEVLGEVLAPRPAEYVELTLFRIVQEALTNSIKHAQATRVMVVLTADDTTIYLSISDDGIGIDSAIKERTDQQGWGLITMRERAEAIGGHCHIGSSPFLGTLVMIKVQR